MLVLLIYTRSRVTKGWDDMSGFKAEDADFFEYGSYGPGAKVSDTRRVLTDEQAREYTIANVFFLWI